MARLDSNLGASYKPPWLTRSCRVAYEISSLGACVRIVVRLRRLRRICCAGILRRRRILRSPGGNLSAGCLAGPIWPAHPGTRVANRPGLTHPTCRQSDAGAAILIALLLLASFAAS